jgi:hypothetical protein
MPTVRWLRRHWFALTFLALLVVTEIAVAVLPPVRQAGVAAWASTSVTNLQHHPAGALVASAFVNADHPLVWPALASMGLFGADRVLRPARAAVLCVLAHVAGTLISEGIVAYRVRAGGLPSAALSQVDVGSSYVVVAALVVAVLAGTWPARTVALAGLLTVLPFLFAGLSRLEVSAVGHTVSLAIGAVGACRIVLRHRRRRTPARARLG